MDSVAAEEVADITVANAAMFAPGDAVHIHADELIYVKWYDPKTAKLTVRRGKQS